MAVPTYPALLLPVLRLAADGKDHGVEELRKRIALEFDVTPEEQATKLKSGSTVFVNRVAWALAELNLAKAVTLIQKGVYRISNRGLGILNANSSDITVKELRSLSF
jgi:restriction system protein